jgi:hypothetical protein
MPVLKGNTNVDLALSGYNIPYTIKSFSLSNKTAGNIDITVYIQDGVIADVAITPYKKQLAVEEAYITNIPVLVLANENIYIETTGSVDYYFTIE